MQNFLSQAQRLWRDLDKLIFGDELDGLLKVQSLKRNEADRIVGCRCTHIGKFLLTHHVDVEIDIARVLSDDHALIDVSPGSDKQFATFLQIVESISRGYARTIGHQSAGNAMRDFALIFNVSVKE